MRKHTPPVNHLELQRLLELTERVGRDPLLTQASTGNSSEKLDDVLWIKASGKWMANAMRDDILIPLDLKELLTDCLRHDVDPAERYPGASLETAMHAAIPHRVVLHVHCVNTIAWAVRQDALIQLEPRLKGLRWQWIPYAASGLPLSKQIEHALYEHPDTDLFVLANHGLVLGGDSAEDVGNLLSEVQRRLSITPRQARGADYQMLREMCEGSGWRLPEDEELHALATDNVSQGILAGGLLYPCQALFSDSGTPAPFTPISRSDLGGPWQTRYRNRPFLMIEGRGVIVNGSARPAELAMIRGLAHVVQRLSASAPVRYLTRDEISGISSEVADRYRELANASHANASQAVGG